jgi:hypothetical protein
LKEARAEPNQDRGLLNSASCGGEPCHTATTSKWLEFVFINMDQNATFTAKIDFASGFTFKRHWRLGMHKETVRWSP